MTYIFDDLLDDTIALSKENLALSTPEEEFSHFKEEMAELILDLERKNRGRATDENVLEEVVDVFMFTIEMGLCHFGSDFLNMLAKKNEKFRKAIAKRKMIW